MAIPEPRQHLKRLIEEKVRGSATALTDLPYDVVPYIADAVLELFPDVEVKYAAESKGAFIATDAAGTLIAPTHTRYVLRTSPEPVQDGPGGDVGTPASHLDMPEHLAAFGATLTEDERRAWQDAMAAQRIPDPAVEELATELAEERTLHQQTIGLVRLLHAVYTAWNGACRCDPTPEQVKEGYSTLVAVESWQAIEAACAAVDAVGPQLHALLAETTTEAEDA